MGYEVARYLGIDSVDSPAVTPGGRLLFLADTTGTAQVWTVDGPGTWPTRLTPYEERVSTVAASPTDEAFVFGMDAGGNERDQLFRYDLPTGEIARLTDDPEAKHAWGAWAPDGERVAYTANRREAGAFDAYVQGRDETHEAADRVFEGAGGWLTVEAWTPGDRLVLAKPRSSADVDLYLLDPASGERTRLSGDDAARYAHVAVGPDGDAVYAVTNHDSDTAYLGRIDVTDPTPGAVETVVEGSEEPRSSGSQAAPGDGDWDVDGLAVHDSGRVVWTRNVDGYSELHAGTLSADGRAVAETAAPTVDGVVTGLTFGPGGERYAYTLTENTRPYGVHLADFGTVGDARWTPVGTNGIPRSSFRAAETIRYETFDGREIPAYWTLPASASADGAQSAHGVPVIVDIHGGPEHQRRPWFYPTKQFFLNRGYAVLEPNVRGSSGYGRAYTHLDDVKRRLDSVRDVKHAVEWLGDQPAVDDDRVVAYGRSYGGFMVLAAITEYPDLWAAAVEFVGIANFVTFLENTGDWRRSHREAEYGSLDDDRELLEEISPIHDVDRIECPLFVQHGANDPRVPVEEARQVAETARQQGVPVETLIFDDEGHHTTSRANLIEEFEAIAAFLDEHV
ncbi:MAG: S9 family peptidase [Halobacteriales archaeon]